GGRLVLGLLLPLIWWQSSVVAEAAVEISLLAVLRWRNGQIGAGTGAGAEERKCWRRLFTVADRATVGLWPIEEKLGVAGSIRVVAVVGGCLG
ncbi:hypothetical protein H0E87_031160, partial [Populus deltoides]